MWLLVPDSDGFPKIPRDGAVSQQPGVRIRRFQGLLLAPRADKTGGVVGLVPGALWEDFVVSSLWVVPSNRSPDTNKCRSCWI